MARTTYIALLLVVPAVAVAGCGGNDDSASKSSAESGASGQQGTTSPQTGASGGTGGARPIRPPKSGRAPGKKRGSDQSNTGSTAPAAPKPGPTGPGQTGGATSLTKAQLKLVGRQLYKQARFLCKASTLQGLAQQYGIKPDPDKVAKAFAAQYLVGLRHQVAAGCKKGLLESK